MTQKRDLRLLRPFDLEAAKAGALVTSAFPHMDGAPIWKLKAGPDAKGLLVMEILRTGEFACAAPAMVFCMAPLCWIEGRPVYKDDVLYWKCDRAKFTAGAKMLPEGLIEGVSVMCDGTVYDQPNTGIMPDDLTWTKPAPLKLKKYGWLNVYKGFCAGAVIHKTRKDADNFASPNRVACVEIEWEELSPQL